MARKTKNVYQVKVSLDNIHPAIWRRFQVPENTTLQKLHDILQIIMGWQDYHMHMFTIDGQEYGQPEVDEFGDLGILDESRAKLSDVIQRVNQRFKYMYDFGDSWKHTLVVEEILPEEKGVTYLRCIIGKRACPPEDVGGPLGYSRFLKVIGNPRSPQYKETLEWVGGKFYPEAFDLQDVNTRLSRMGRGKSQEIGSPWYMDEPMEAEKREMMTAPLSKPIPESFHPVLEALSLRRDVTSLITYIRDNKVNGTQSTGNLPLKAVREICSLFVDPPETEYSIGEEKYQVRSELDVPGLYFVHVVAFVAGLVEGGMARRWKLTALGEDFLLLPASQQVWYLLNAWWFGANWMVRVYHSPYDELPFGYQIMVLKGLLEQPVGKKIPYKQFIKKMAEATNYPLGQDDPTIGYHPLDYLFRDTIISPMVDFGMIETEFVSKTHEFGWPIETLDKVQITPLGKELLEHLSTWLQAKIDS